MRSTLPRRVALLLVTHFSIVSSQQFDTVTECIPSGTEIVFTKTLSCPCYLGYSLYSPIDTNITTDFLLLPTTEYKLWQANNFTNSPSVLHQHSTFNVSTASSLFKTPLETPSGSYTFVIRTHASKSECSIRLLHVFTQIPSCETKRGNKIVGGSPAPSLTKHMVILESETGYCSGTLVSKIHILTAAHCNAQSGIARMGSPSGAIYNIESFHTHPLYEASVGLPEFDIGIVRLSQAVNDTDGTALRFAHEGSITEKVTVTGFGQTHERIPGTAFRELRAVEVGSIGLSECRKRFSEMGFGDVGRGIGKGMLCLGGECGDSCYGDSGGGALIENDRGLVVVGIVSGGIGCGRNGLPGVYTSVVEFAEWVEDVVGIDGVMIGEEGGKSWGWIGVGVVGGLVMAVGIVEGVNCGVGRLGVGRKNGDDDKWPEHDVIRRVSA